MPKRPHHKWIILASGLRQNEGQHNGIGRVDERLRKFDKNGTRVILRPWDSNWRDLAKRIKNDAEYADVDVRIYGYSYGGGWGAMQLARELEARSIDVTYMVLSDPVFRSAWLFMRWLSIIPPRRPQGRERTKWGWIKRGARELLWRFGQRFNLVPEISVPANVLNVTAFYQSLNIPMGHDLRFEGQPVSFTVRHVRSRHETMDDFLPFHDECERVTLL